MCIRDRLKINHILTAHHLNDSLESFIINISRGSGLDGLTGVPMLNGKIKRPLIDFEKQEIINYAKNKNLRWREDSSNNSNSYLRNKVRNNIINELEDLEGNFFKNFKKTIKVRNFLLHRRVHKILNERTVGFIYMIGVSSMNAVLARQAQCSLNF